MILLFVDKWCSLLFMPEYLAIHCKAMWDQMDFVSLRKLEFPFSSETHVNIKSYYGFMNTFQLASDWGYNSYLIMFHQNQHFIATHRLFCLSFTKSLWLLVIFPEVIYLFPDRN